MLFFATGSAFHLQRVTYTSVFNVWLLVPGTECRTIHFSTQASTSVFVSLV